MNGQSVAIAVGLCTAVLLSTAETRAEDAPLAANVPASETQAGDIAPPASEAPSETADLPPESTASPREPTASPREPAGVADPSAPEPLLFAAPPAPPPKKPSSLRVPAFIALGVGGLGAGGAVLAGLAANAPYNDPRLGCNGRCADSSRTLAVTSTVLAGVGVVGIGVGIALLMRSTRAERPASLSPMVGCLGLSPRKLGATALWRF